MYTYLNRLVSFLKGPLSLILILVYYNEVEQGWWYLFLSLGIIASIIDFGISSLLTQRISRIYGKTESITESSQEIKGIFFHFLKYYGRIVIVFMLYNIAIGTLYLETFKAQWYSYSFSLVLYFLFTPFHHVYMGLNRISIVQNALLWGNLISACCLLIMLYYGLGLWSLGVSVLVNCLMANFIFLFRTKFFWKILLNTPFKKIENIFDLKSLQKKYILSWICGIIMFNTIIPFISKQYDIVDAGKIGLILNLFSFLLSLAVADIYNKIPEINILVEQRRIDESQNIFRSTLYRGVLVYIGLSIAAFLTLVVVDKFWPILDRLPVFALSFLVFVFVLSKVLASIVASYFRSFNIEPFYLLNLGMAGATILAYIFVVFSGIGLSNYLLALSISHLVSVIIWYLINHDRWIKS